MKEYYKDQLKNPAWNAKRKRIMKRDGFKCRFCGDTKTELNAHHKYYSYDLKAWEYPDDALITLCKTCHETIHIYIKDITINIGQMKLDQLYFTVDIISMLKLADKELCLQTLEFLTSKLKEKTNG